MAKSEKWTPEDIERARRMRAEGMTLREIGEALGRTVGAVASKVWLGTRVSKPKPTLRKTHDDGRLYIPERVQIDRDRRINAPHTLTGLVLGDPPIGFSALDRRGA